MTSTRLTPTPHLPQGRPDLPALRRAVHGQVFCPSEPGYLAATAAWNRNATHRPDIVVVAQRAADVAAAVRFAGPRRLGVAVMATGHGTGIATAGGVLVNTSRLRRLRIDVRGRRARVEAGVLWADVAAEAAPHGLTGLPGSSSHVGVVGYTSGGGFGWLGRHFGLAADHVTAARVVTAAGQVLRTDRRNHPDLFWGIRGGGGNFGVIMALEFRLHRLTNVHAGALYYPVHRAREVLQQYAEWCPTLPDEMASAAAFIAFPPVPDLPAPLRGKKFLAIRACYSGPAAQDGAVLLDLLRRDLGAAEVDTVNTRRVADLDAVSLDPVQPIGALVHSEMLHDLTPGTIDTLVGLGTDSPLVSLEVRQLGGALTPEPSRLSPMGRSGARFTINAIGLTATPEQTSAVRSYLRHVASSLEPHATGTTYHNFLELDGATPQRIRAAYSPADWSRLVELKDRYDPNNLFRFNRNIPPSGGTR